jgi:hypothetical protein
MSSAGTDIHDQPIHRVPHCDCIVQGRQRIHVFAGSMAIVPAPNAAQFGSLVGIGMEETQAARGSRGPAGFAALCPSLTTPIKILRRHV